MNIGAHADTGITLVMDPHYIVHLYKMNICIGHYKYIINNYNLCFLMKTLHCMVWDVWSSIIDISPLHCIVFAATLVSLCGYQGINEFDFHFMRLSLNPVVCVDMSGIVFDE